MFNKKSINELVSYTDKTFTYDFRKMKREDKNVPFDFIAKNYDTNTTVAIDVNKCGVWLHIKKGEKDLINKHAKSYRDIKEFKNLIYAIG